MTCKYFEKTTKQPNTISTERLREVLEYDHETGVFTWLERAPGRRKNGRAGCIRKSGYVVIRIDGRTYLSHRLAWQHFYIEVPTNEIDHINGVKDDNRIANLRLATTAENGRNRGKQTNNTSGFKGVSWKKSDRRWCAQIKYFGRNIYLGLYSTPEEASAAYEAKARELFGSFYQARIHSNDNAPLANGRAA